MTEERVPKSDRLFDQAYQWCLTSLPAEPVYIGSQQQEVNAIDSSTIARWRAKAGMDLLGKGYAHQAGKAVNANIVAVVTTIVFITYPQGTKIEKLPKNSPSPANQGFVVT